MLIVMHAGDVWRVLSEGSNRGSRTYCHLASTTRFDQDDSARIPIKMWDWVENRELVVARIRQEDKQRTNHTCIPWRGSDKDRGLCIYCGRDTRDPITAYYEDRNISGLGVLDAHR